jgi:diaminopimelate epimerase
MRMQFTKMHGLGNDFIVFDAAQPAGLPSATQFRALADRHTGIGFDQALAVIPARRDDTLAFYRIFNADGSEVEQCGNGVRCVAEWLQSRGRAPQGDAAMRLDSEGGVVAARVLQPGLVAVDMGEPNFKPAALPFVPESPALESHANAGVAVAALSPRYGLSVGGDERIEIGVVSVGNPHAVLLVPSVDNAPVEHLGPRIESHRAFPKRVNAGFMQIVDDTHIRLRVFERGVGETRACGTGACAAVAVGRKAGRLAASVEVALPGGVLRIEWPGPGHSLWMTGPALQAFEGQVDL